MYLKRLSILCIVLTACSGQSSIDERLVSTYASVLVVRESTIDSARSKQRFDSVLAANGYTTESFDAALRAQSLNRDRFKQFYDSVVVRVRAKR